MYLSKTSADTSLLSKELLASDRGRFVVVYEVYVDESGLHEDAPAMCVGAYGGTPEEWAGFAEDWSRVLSNSPIKFFHAVNSQCDPLRQPLIDALKKRRLYGVALSVSHTDYRDHTLPQFRSLMGDAYRTCGTVLVSHMCRIATEQGLGPCTFTIEQGRHARKLETVLLKLMEYDLWPIVRVGIGKKGEFLPSDAADLLAHCFGVEDVDCIRAMEVLNVHHKRITQDILKEQSLKAKEAYRDVRLRVGRLKREAGQ